MQPQRSLADAEDDGTKRQTRRAQFLQQMDALIPWARLEQRIRPFDPTAGRGRPPYPLSVMRRIHGVQLGYDRSDPAIEDARDDRLAVQRVVGMSLREPLPDETTIRNFRHLLERHGRGEALLAEITEHLAARGVRLRAGTIVDATIIDALASGATGPAHGLAGGGAARGGGPGAGGASPILYVKRHFGYAQVRYRGLAKNRNRLCLWLGLANLWLAERQATA